MEIAIVLLVLCGIFIIFLVLSNCIKTKDEQNDVNTPTVVPDNFNQSIKKEYNPLASRLERALLRYSSNKERYQKAIEQFENMISSFNYKLYEVNDCERVYVIQDSCIMYIGIYERRVYELPGLIIPCIYIEELTYNSVFKFNATAFGAIFNEPKYELKVIRFYNYEQKKGFAQCGNTKTFYIDKKLPELNLLHQIENWEGLPYHYIVVELYDENGTAATVKYITNNNIDSEAQSFCRKIERLEIQTEPHNKIDNILICKKLKKMRAKYIESKQNNETLEWTLRGHLRYFYISETSTDYDLQSRGKEILDEYLNGKIENIEWLEYGRFDGKWKSELLVFELCQKIYGANNVIFQYSPFFLGAQSYDVYIISKKTAIEYQGKQHSEPVEFFGGQESFEKQQERDARKRQLSKENKVKLVYINYDEPITEALIRERVESKK